MKAKRCLNWFLQAEGILSEEPELTQIPVEVEELEPTPVGFTRANGGGMVCTTFLEAMGAGDFCWIEW